MSSIVCRPKPLAPSQAAEAIRRAMLINPGNGAGRRSMVRTPVDGKPIPDGRDINPTDVAFAASIYPKRVTAPRSRR
jgi:hypothetical protein